MSAIPSTQPTRVDLAAARARVYSPLDALRELVALKAIKDRLDAHDLEPARRVELLEAFNRRWPLAWDTARAAIARAEELRQ